MYRHLLPPASVWLSLMVLPSCAPETTQPSLSEASVPVAPALTVTSNSWLTRRNMPIDRVFMTVATVPDAAGRSVVYAIGGMHTTTRLTLGEVRAYNAATNTWQYGRKDMPEALYQTNGAGVIDGKIYISGGLPYAWTKLAHGPSKSLFVYDPAKDTWTRKKDMPEVGGLGVTGVIDGKLYVISNCFEVGLSKPQWSECWAIEGGRPDIANFFRYDPATDSWARLPSPKHTYHVGGVIDRKFYVAEYNGGYGSQELEVYDPSTNSWATAAAPPYDLPPSFATLGGKLWVFGLHAIHIYDPATDAWGSRPLTTDAAVADMKASKVLVGGKPRFELIGGNRPGNNLQYVP
jgi:hypothetical protein